MIILVGVDVPEVFLKCSMKIWVIRIFGYDLNRSFIAIYREWGRCWFSRRLRCLCLGLLFFHLDAYSIFYGGKLESAPVTTLSVIPASSKQHST